MSTASEASSEASFRASPPDDDEPAGGGYGALFGVPYFEAALAADQSHMTRCMRRVLGTTPAALSREIAPATNSQG